MRIFLDFEASSLGKNSYPIEVGWAAEDGSAESHLIRPAPGWSDWDAAAEAVHHIAREQLVAEGEPYRHVAQRVLEVLKPHEVFVSAPSWDGKWMSVLLRAAGVPRHILKLRDSEDAFRTAAVDGLRDRMPGDRLEGVSARLIAEARRLVTSGPPAHRALADAMAELEIWREVQRLAAKFGNPDAA